VGSKVRDDRREILFRLTKRELGSLRAIRRQAMLTKPLDDIDRGDIDALVTNGISEGTSLEFKREPIAQNDEVARDVAAMANGGGGDIVLGLEEVNGIARAVTPFPNGEDEANRVVQIVLAGVSPRLPIGTRVASGQGGDVVVVRVSRARIPAMVHLGNRTDFWERRDRQRVRMTHTEIVSRVREGLADTQERAGFIQRRIEFFRTLSLGYGGTLGILLAVTPDTLGDSEAVSIRDANIQRAMSDPSQIPNTLIESVSPRPSLHGLEGHGRDLPAGYHFEIFRNGHVEMWLLNAHEHVAAVRDRFVWGPRGERIDLSTVLNGDLLARSVVEIVRRAKRVYELSGLFGPHVVTLALVNAMNTLLPGRTTSTPEGTVVEDPGTLWNGATLRVQAPGFPEEAAGLTAKRLCDLFWQAYGKWVCPRIDAQGHLA
jgi:hypothetical protein